MITGNKKYKYKISKISSEISLKDFRFPSVNQVQSVGQLLKAIRVHLSDKYGAKFSKAFTQIAVAEYMGYSTAQYIYIVEKGDVEPSLDFCAKICDYYGIPIEYMYDLFIEIRSREYKKAFLEKDKERHGS